MKTTLPILLLIFVVFACKTNTPLSTYTAIPGDYEPQAGDRVKLTGVFRTGKGYVGRMGEIIIPHFDNQEEEALKYQGKWVRVTGTIYAPYATQEEDTQKVARVQGIKKVQGLRGLHLKQESIEILSDDEIKLEKVEKLQPVQ